MTPLHKRSDTRGNTQRHTPRKHNWCTVASSETSAAVSANMANQNSLHAWSEQIWTRSKQTKATQQYLPLLANISHRVTSRTRPNSFDQSSWGYSVELCCVAYKWHLKASWMFSSSDACFRLLVTAAVTDPWMLRTEKIPKHCKRCRAATWGKVIRIINLGLHMFHYVSH